VRPPTKPEPDKVTTVPPDTAPEDGITELTEPTPAYSTCTPLRLISPPLLSAISTERMPAPRGGTTQRTDDEDSTVPADTDHVSADVDAPKPQNTPLKPDADKPTPRTTTEDPPLTGTTSAITDVTLASAMFSTITPDAVNSWPFTDTSTDVLPNTPATDTHVTTRASTDRADTTTRPPSLHHASLPASAPETTNDIALPPSTVDTAGDTDTIDIDL
jgi:hypothetical protein